jgi:hypothetical protein
MELECTQHQPAVIRSFRAAGTRRAAQYHFKQHAATSKAAILAPGDQMLDFLVN